MRPGGGVLDRRGEVGGCPFPTLHQLRFDQPGDAPRGDAERGRRQLAGGHRGHPVHQVVRLVDDQQLMFGQHGRVGDGVDGQQRVVGDDNISPAGSSSCPFGEAFGAERAAGHAEAFPRGHADLCPGSVGYAGLEVVAVTGLRRRRPGGEPLHVATQRGDRLRLEELVLRFVIRIGSRRRYESC